MIQRKFLAFDIETKPQNFDELSESQQEYLLRGAKSEDEIEKKKGEMALSGLTGEVVCIGLALCSMNEFGEGIIEKQIALSLIDDGRDYEFEIQPDDKGNLKITLANSAECLLGDEKWIIDTFWKILDKYSDADLISFNGRGFDAPFLMHRSAIFGIRPSRNIMDGTRFNYSQHIDLLDELTFYSTSSYGATRRFNFDFYTRAFGIHSPKSEGLDGSKVAEFYKEGKIAEIAEYCLRDVVATWELFLYWNKYLNFKR